MSNVSVSDENHELAIYRNLRKQGKRSEAERVIYDSNQSRFIGVLAADARNMDIFRVGSGPWGPDSVSIASRPDTKCQESKKHSFAQES